MDVKRGRAAAVFELAAEVTFKGDVAEDSAQARRKAILPSWPVRGDRQTAIADPLRSVKNGIWGR